MSIPSSDDEIRCVEVLCGKERVWIPILEYKDTPSKFVLLKNRKKRYEVEAE